MIMRLLLPRLSAAMSEGTLVTWHKQEGETIGYGDELCDIVVAEVTRLRRRLSARTAVGRRSSDKARYRTLQGVAVRFRLVSAENGVLRSIVAPEGTPVAEGSLLGILGWGDESGDVEGAAPAARIVVNLLTSEEGATP